MFWLLVAVMLGDYLAMVLWSIPRVSAEAGGLAIFDMRPASYSYEEATAFLAALTPDGARFYIAVQHRLDAAYPALLAAVLFWSILRLAPRSWGAWRWLAAATALPGMIFDYLEKRDVATMIALGPDGVTPAMVEAASLYSRLKAGTSTVAMTILLALLVLWAVRRRHMQRAP